MKMRERKVRKLSPRVECLECRELLSLARATLAATQSASRGKIDAVPVAVGRAHATTSANRPVMAAKNSPSTATFIDPTAVIHNPRATTIGSQDYVAPFATLTAKCGGTITIGNASLMCRIASRSQPPAGAQTW
jgi:hypothetical protein